MPTSFLAPSGATVYIIETVPSQEDTVSFENPQRIVRLVAFGSELDTDIEAAVDSYLPTFYAAGDLDLVIKSYHILHRGNGIWDVDALYIRYNSTLTFDTTGGTQHITQSLNTMFKEAANGLVAPDFKGAIGVSTDSVQGIDVTVPAFKWSETYHFLPALVTQLYIGILAALTGTKNQDAFRNYEAGEVKFLGASGTQSSADDFPITFHFAQQDNQFPNVTGIGTQYNKLASFAFTRGQAVYQDANGNCWNNPAQGELIGTANTPPGDQVTDTTVLVSTGFKRGWDYLWVRYQDFSDQNCLVKRPIAAYIEEVAYDGDFSLLGIGT